MHPQNLKACVTADQLLAYINNPNAPIQISTTCGGRKYKFQNGEQCALKSIVKQLESIPRNDETKAEIRLILRKIDVLNNLGNAQINEKNLLIRIVSIFRSFLANLGYDYLDKANDIRIALNIPISDVIDLESLNGRALIISLEENLDEFDLKIAERDANGFLETFKQLTQRASELLELQIAEPIDREKVFEKGNEVNELERQIRNNQEIFILNYKNALLEEYEYNEGEALEVANEIATILTMYQNRFFSANSKELYLLYKKYPFLYQKYTIEEYYGDDNLDKFSVLAPQGNCMKK